MTDGEALYRAILESPDDDAPRLVWADWLEENGDPERAEFVRLQCEWAALDPGDPRQEELWERWGGLLDRNRDRWTSDLGPLARNCGFWRGLPDWFDVTTGEMVEQVEALRRYVPAQCLNVQLNLFRDALRAWDGLDSVRCLDIAEKAMDPYYPHTSLRGWVWLLQCTRLRGLRSIQVEMDIASAGALAALSGTDWPHLRELSIRLHNAEPGKLPNAWTDLPHAMWYAGLKSLDLWGCAIGEEGMACFVLAYDLPKLTRLGLGMNHISPEVIRGLAKTTGFEELRCIELNGNPVGTAIGDLLSSSRLPNLCALAASDVVAEGESSRDLVNAVVAVGWSRLRILEFNSNALDTEAVERLVESPAAARLEVLALNGNDLTDAAAFALAGSPRLRRLRRLDLAGNRLTDAGLQALASSPNLPNLRTLTLKHNIISADAIIDFKDTDLARQLWRLETDFMDPPRRKYGYEALL